MRRCYHVHTMATAILHIGTPKTATTSLQAFFHANRELLADAGVCFPIMPFQNARSGKFVNGAFLYELQYLVRPKNSLLFTPMSLDLRRSLRVLGKLGKSGANTLLSEENLLSPELNWHRIVSILKECGFDDLRVIVYLRRQDAMLLSMWKQACEGGYHYYMTDSLRSFCDFDFNRSWGRYAERLLHVQSCLERGSIVVRRFDRNRFVGGDIYHDFCDAAGIPWNDAFTIPEDLNPSISCDIAMVMSALTAAGLPEINTGHAGRRLLMELAEELSQRFPDEPGTFPMPPEERRELMERYTDGNLFLSVRYFGGEPFGDEPPADYPVWEPNEERTRAMIGALYDALAERMGRPGRDGQASAAELVALADSV